LNGPTYTLSPLELAAGVVFEHRPAPAAPDYRGTAREALVDAVRGALQRPPCLVSFSGGRDSSTVLALATDVARREGLPLPIPITATIVGDAGSAESDWQQVVIDHLRLDEWVRVELTDELDVLGPIARDVLVRHGILWPTNLHFHVPLLERSARGSLLTGIGGDETLMKSLWAASFGGQRPPSAGSARWLAFALSPQWLRRAAIARRSPPPAAPWLRPGPQQAARAGLIRAAAAESARWGDHFLRLRAAPSMAVSMAGIDVLGRDHDVVVVHPLWDARFHRALAALPRRSRFRSRTEAMRALFSDLLPDELLARKGKARFDAAAWSRWSREFVERWDGSGVDTELVDPEALLVAWRADVVDPRSYALLQATWLRQEGRDASAPVGSRDSS
jgi:asparagine synthase (glutamine-hydrolysing)